MIMILLSELTRFQTKKRSSSPLWAAWCAALVTGIVLAMGLSALVARTSNDPQVRFVGLRFASFEGLRSQSLPGEAWLNDTSPLVVLGEGQVIFGTVAQVMQPIGRQDVLIVPRADWQTSLAKRISTWPSARKMLPARVVGFAADPGLGLSGDWISLLHEVSSAFRTINGHFEDVGLGERTWTDPLVLFVRVAGLKQGE